MLIWTTHLSESIHLLLLSQAIIIIIIIIIISIIIIIITDNVINVTAICTLQFYSILPYFRIYLHQSIIIITIIIITDNVMKITAICIFQFYFDIIAVFFLLNVLERSWEILKVWAINSKFLWVYANLFEFG